ncbi:MAG: hypothetical protein AMJ79_06220 [Phycisphaerae bacterium SM23_30]|nr:MAG: hypothetical protein AMJ79_06220 [Phycisphaerae bacterium SM23_30]
MPHSSHEIRLSPREWIITLVIIAGLFYLIPVGWQRLESLETNPDYRIPYELSSDYWLFSRYCRSVCAADKMPVIGDSVIWGQYVKPDQTLTHYLNELAGADLYANLGVDGTHPMVLAGLIEYYGKAIKDKDVILHLNLLWMTSPRADLQIEKEFAFNHPRLAPQFIPPIPCYTASVSEKIGIIMERRVPFFSWLNHLHRAYYDNQNLQNWTLENPYACPFAPVTFELIPPGGRERQKPIPWTEKTAAPQAFPWVEPDTSLQWQAFLRLVKTLQKRNNRLFIIVGPFNEHMLDDQSRKTYTAIKNKVETCLQEKNLPCYLPPPLPPSLYADASHPLPAGYAQLAHQLFELLNR